MNNPLPLLLAARNSQPSLASRLYRRCNALIANAPPPLGNDYSRADYLEFMKSELMQYSPAYARGRVLLREQHHLLAALQQSNVILGLLHHGSWILIGGVFRYVFNLPYTVVASRRNLDIVPQSEVDYWQKAHRFIAKYYGSKLFYSDQLPMGLFRWLREKTAVLGVAFDVREYNQHHKEAEINFSGHTLWIQSGPAKLARLSKSIIVPAGIHYVPQHKVHELIFYKPINPADYTADQLVTQQLFSSLEDHYLSYDQQGFNDLIDVFSRPHTVNK